jgi:hypothetical protein
MLEYPTMTTLPPPLNPEKRPRVRNARTAAKIRRDLIWQIAVPIGLAVVVVLVLAGLFISPVWASVRSPWADVSLIFLIIPALLMGLIALALVAALVAGMVWLLRNLPYYFKTMQDFMAVFSYRVQTGADKAAGVFMSARSAAAAAQRAARDVRRAVERGG